MRAAWDEVEVSDPILAARREAFAGSAARPIIRNRECLLEHGNVEGRRVVLDILEAGLAAPDPYPTVRRLVRLEGRKLVIAAPDLSEPVGRAPLVLDLDEIGKIYVVGGGKAAQREAEAVEDALGDLIAEGHINAKKGDSVRLRRCTVSLCGHPLPDEESVEGARRIVEIERKARKGDVVFVCTSGGATALTALPVPGISLTDLQEVYRVLYFARGANMPAANAVRNHLALLNTKHQRYTGEATVIQILTTETPPKPKAHLYEASKHGTPYEAAIGVLRSYHCWDLMPDSVREFLLRGDPRFGPLTSAEKNGPNHHNFRVMGPEYMIEAAREKAESLGLNAIILAGSLNDVEARPIGEAFGAMALEAEVLDRPVPPPGVLICGGELVVSVGDATGIGGRGQEFVLSAATRISGSKRIVIASADSDGSDGPTPAAGAIVDGETIARATAAGIDVDNVLERHDSHTALAALGDTFETGVRWTNVRDLRVIYIGK